LVKLLELTKEKVAVHPPCSTVAPIQLPSFLKSEIICARDAGMPKK